MPSSDTLKYFVFLVLHCLWSPDNLESILIEYLVDDNHSFNNTILEDIKSKLNTLTKNCLDIQFQEVEKIKPSKSGKPQIIESNLKTV